MRGQINPAYIETEYAWLEPGETARGICLACRGGDSKEKSLKVTRGLSGGYSYICWRASCGIRSYGTSHVVPSAQARPMFFVGIMEHLPVRLRRKLSFAYDLSPESLDALRYAPESGRVLFPVRSPGPFYGLRGWVARSFGTLLPKTLNYRETVQEPFIGWFGDVSESHQIVLVEDCISALKVSQVPNCVGVSLNGTNITDDAFEEIRHVAQHRQVYVALDRDAFSKGLTYVQRFRPRLSVPWKAWRLARDLKYETERTIEKVIEDGTADFGNFDGEQRGV